MIQGSVAKRGRVKCSPTYFNPCSTFRLLGLLVVLQKYFILASIHLHITLSVVLFIFNTRAPENTIHKHASTRACAHVHRHTSILLKEPRVFAKFD